MIAALIAAMMLIESGGNAGAIGDGGRALGCLQIRACVIADVNKYYGATYMHEDALDLAKAARICRLYIEAYAPPGAGLETMARIWNGGPNGPNKESTRKYWHKVEVKYRELAVQRERVERKADSVKRQNQNDSCSSGAAARY